MSERFQKQPTSIVRTLPYHGVRKDKISQRSAYRQAAEGFRSLNKSDGNLVYIAMASVPKIPVLNCYFVMRGRIRWRARIVGFEKGEPLECWDGVTRCPRYWMLVAGPAERAPERIERRGGQGFRYTEELW